MAEDPIHRPTLISGDSQSGRFNPHDLLSALIAGCVRMGVAPDLDWELDAMPVDCVADVIVHLSDVGRERPTCCMLALAIGGSARCGCGSTATT